MCPGVFTKINSYGFVAGIKYQQHNKVIHNIDLYLIFVDNAISTELSCYYPL